MSVSSNYLADLVRLATAAAQTQKDNLDAAYNRAVGGKITGTGKDMVYTGPGEGDYQGTYDVGYTQGKKRYLGSMESRGMLKSGERAVGESDLLNTYKQSVIDLYNKTAAEKAGIGAKLATDIADYNARYGTEPETVAAPLPKQDQQTPASNNNANNTPASTASSPYPSSVDKPAPERTPYEAAAFQALGQPETMAQAKPAPGPSADQQLGDVLFGNAVPWGQIDTSAFTTTAANTTPMAKAMVNTVKKKVKKGG